MIFLAAPPTASLPMTQGKGPHKQPPFAAIFAPSSRGNMVAGKVFVRVIWFTGKDPRTRYRDCWWIVAIGDAPRRAGRESALGGFRQGIESAIPALRRYARALTRNVELADDLVQDTLMRALR